MRPVRLLAAALALAAGLAAAPSRAAAAPCGLPDASPLWVEYGQGSVRFRNAVFARAGVVVATSGTVGVALRRGGAQTVDWEMNLKNFVGTPAAPAAPERVVANAAGLFDRAVRETGCATPLVALNELLKPTVPPPWPGPLQAYRANVLALLQTLAQRGARPFLLVPSNPSTAAEAGDWWRQAAQVADVVRQVYLPAPRVVGEGAVLGNRELRTKLRVAVASLTSAGIPPSRVGLMLGFQSNGIYGRAGLQPREEWLRYVKWSALAAKEVAAETGISSIWSWGWGTFASGADPDPDKAAAACVWLWTRDPGLCDGPAAAGPAFDTSREEGQIVLPDGVRCTVGSATIADAEVAQLKDLSGGDAGRAFGAALERVARDRLAPVSEDDVRAAESGVVWRAFAGDRRAYLAELARRGATLAQARLALADALQRDRLAAGGGNVLGAVLAEEQRALAEAVCRGDVFPAPGAQPLASTLRFLVDAPAPAAPAGASAAPAGAGIGVAWQLGGQRTIAGYAVERAPAADGPWTRVVPYVSGTGTTDLPPAGTWFYRVVAVDLAGRESPPSAVVSAAATGSPPETPAPAAPAPAPPAPDVAVSGTVTPLRARVGRTVVYRIALTERAGAATPTLALVDTLPAAATLVSAWAEGGACTGARVVRCTPAPLAARGRALVTLVVRVTRAGPLVNVARASAAGDGRPGNDVGTWRTTALGSTRSAAARRG